MRFTYAKLFLISFINLSLYGQYFDTISIPKKINFVNHLRQNKQIDDACYLLNYFNSQVQIDSLKLMEVKLLLELRREKDADSLLQSCANLFPDSSSLKCSYILLKNHARLLNGKYDEITDPRCPDHLSHREIWRLQLLSAAILKNKTNDFEMVFNSGKCYHPNLSLIELSMYDQNIQLKERRKKSGFVAGMLSAILPGSGKIYASKPREALTGFLPVAFNLVQAGEGYYYKKFESPHLYIFGSISTAFYASGIYGSVRAANRKNTEFKDKIKANVEFEITKLIVYY